VTVTVASTGSATVGAGSLAGGSGASVSAEVGVRVDVRARDRSSAAVRLRLARPGLRIDPPSESADRDCAAHSYGQVRKWFREHRCDALFRALFRVRDRHGAVVLVAVAWVDMPDETSAIELKHLLDRDGTGNITELSRERGRYRSVRFTGEHYVSRRSGTTVVNAQAQPVGRAAAAVDLAMLVADAVGGRR
jgi:hypothetical protein